MSTFSPLDLIESEMWWWNVLSVSKLVLKDLCEMSCILKTIPEPCWEWFPNTHLVSQRQLGHLTRTNRKWVKNTNSVRRQSFTNKIKMKNCWLQLNKNGIFLVQFISQFSCTSILSKGTLSNSKQKVSIPS